MERFMMSNSNIVGCCIAMVVLALYLTGVIDSHWYELAAIGYGLGYLVMYRKAPDQVPQGLSSAQTLEWLRNKALPKLTGDAQNLLKSILEIAEELMPRLKEMEAQGIVQAENRSKLKQLLTSYLPDVLEEYLKLPSMYARSVPVNQGKTAQGLLIEQLTLMQSHVTEVRDSFYSENINVLLANGQFLKEKFDKSLILNK
jgi:hypothetical protein